MIPLFCSVKRNPNSPFSLFSVSLFSYRKKQILLQCFWVYVSSDCRLADATPHPPLSEPDSTPAHVKLNEVLEKDFSNSLDHLCMFILFLLSNFRWFNKKQWYLELKFREDLSRCWWYKIFAECPLCFISKNCFVNICYILYL